jgi:hypothetical protein
VEADHPEHPRDGLAPALNDVPIEESERRIFGSRPESEHGLDVPLG